MFKLSKIFVLFAVVIIVASRNLHCNRSLESHRKTYRNILNNRGSIFVLTNYAIEPPNDVLYFAPYPPVEASLSHLQMPILLTQYDDNKTTLIVHAKSGTYFSGKIYSAFDLKIIYSFNLECVSYQQPMQLHVFSSVMMFKEAKQVLFDACHLQIDSSGKLRIEKSLLWLDQSAFSQRRWKKSTWKHRKMDQNRSRIRRVWG